MRPWVECDRLSQARTLLDDYETQRDKRSPVCRICGHPIFDLWEAGFRNGKLRQLQKKSLSPELVHLGPDLFLVDLSQSLHLFLTQGRQVRRVRVIDDLTLFAGAGNDATDLLVLKNPA